MSEASVAIEALLRIRAAASACGLQVEPVAAQSEDGLARVSASEWVAFWAQLGASEATAIRLAERAADGKALTFEYVARNAETIGDALRSIARYGRLEQNVCHRESYISPEGNVSLSHVCGFPEGVSDRAHVVFYFAEIVLLVRSLCSEQSTPTIIKLRDTDPALKPAIEAFFQCQIVLGAPVDEITFSKELAAQPIANPDRKLRTIVARMVDEATHALSDGSSVLSRSEAALARGLLAQNPTLRGLAKSLALSTRTLQRRLAEEGTSAEAIIDRMRHKHALTQLRAGARNMRRLAIELGYASANSFYRAFQRWEHCSPTQFKMRHQEGLVTAEAAAQ